MLVLLKVFSSLVLEIIVNVKFAAELNYGTPIRRLTMKAIYLG